MLVPLDPEQLLVVEPYAPRQDYIEWTNLMKAQYSRLFQNDVQPFFDEALNLLCQFGVSPERRQFLLLNFGKWNQNDRLKFVLGCCDSYGRISEEREYFLVNNVIQRQTLTEIASRAEVTNKRIMEDTERALQSIDNDIRQGEIFVQKAIARHARLQSLQSHVSTSTMARKWASLYGSSQCFRDIIYAFTKIGPCTRGLFVNFAPVYRRHQNIKRSENWVSQYEIICNIENLRSILRFVIPSSAKLWDKSTWVRELKDIKISPAEISLYAEALPWQPTSLVRIEDVKWEPSMYRRANADHFVALPIELLCLYSDCCETEISSSKFSMNQHFEAPDEVLNNVPKEMTILNPDCAAFQPRVTVEQRLSRFSAWDSFRKSEWASNKLDKMDLNGHLTFGWRVNCDEPLLSNKEQTIVEHVNAGYSRFEFENLELSHPLGSRPSFKRYIPCWWCCVMHVVTKDNEDYKESLENFNAKMNHLVKLTQTRPKQSKVKRKRVQEKKRVVRKKK